MSKPWEQFKTTSPTVDEGPWSQFQQEQKLNPEEQMVDVSQVGGSPLSLVDSIKYGLADETGKKKVLGEKFQVIRQSPDGNFFVGDDPTDLMPVEPQGILDDVPTKLAQHIGDINTISASMVGASMGGIPGSAIGGAVGTAVNKALGKAMGVNYQTAQEAATDIVVDGAITMGTGEVVGRAINASLKMAGKHMALKGMNMAEKFINDPSLTTPDKIKRGVGLADILHFTSGTPKEDILTVLNNGAEKTLATEKSGPLAGIVKGSDNHELALIREIHGSTKQMEQTLGTRLGNAEQNFRKNVAKDYPIDTTAIQENAFKQMESLELGKMRVDENTGELAFDVFPNLDTEEKKIVTQFSDHIKNLGGTPFYADETSRLAKVPTGITMNKGTEISVDDMFRRSASIERDIAGAKRAGDGALERSLINLKNGNTNSLYGDPVVGVTDTIADVAAKQGDREYLLAKQNFREFRHFLDNAKAAGLDFENPFVYKNVLKNSLSGNPLLKEAIEGMDNLMGTKYKDSIAMFKAAHTMQGDSSMNVNYLRFGMVMGLTGLASLKDDSLPGRWAYAAAGMGLATPRGTGAILKGMEKSGEMGAKTAIKKGVASSLLRRLLTQSTAQGVSSTIKKSTQKKTE